jgi:hypothetical protein
VTVVVDDEHAVNALAGEPRVGASAFHVHAEVSNISCFGLPGVGVTSTNAT